MSSASAASSRSAAAASSASADSATLVPATITSSPSPTGTSATGTDASGNPNATGASVQGANNGGAFPKWAIAVIVVLGFFALLATGILIFYMVRRFRQRRDGTLSHRNSMGSSTPMMANADRGPQSPVLGSSALEAGAGAAAGYGAGAYTTRRASTGGDGHDGASMTSRTSDAGPFSGADAAIMANAFRQALRKPDFADRPVEEGESPDDHGQAHGHSRVELINQELAEEGRDIRSVSSSRGVRVETLSSDDGNDTATVHDHQH